MIYMAMDVLIGGLKYLMKFWKQLSNEKQQSISKELELQMLTLPNKTLHPNFISSSFFCPF
jgi:hypothetical protein